MRSSTHGLFFCLPGVQVQLHGTEELIRCWQSPGAGEENLVAAPRRPQLQATGSGFVTPRYPVHAAHAGGRNTTIKRPG